MATVGIKGLTPSQLLLSPITSSVDDVCHCDVYCIDQRATTTDTSQHDHSVHKSLQSTTQPQDSAELCEKDNEDE